MAVGNAISSEDTGDNVSTQYIWSFIICLASLIILAVYSLWAKNNAAGNVGTASKHEAEAGNPVARSDADELRKYKSLLDDGVITQEEYDKKKREILKL